MNIQQLTVSSMATTSNRLRAVFLAAALLVAASLPLGLFGTASAQNKSVVVPASRQLGATEQMAAPGNSGTDYSANGGSLAGLTLLATIPAPTVPRLGGVIEAECTAGLVVALDDQAGNLAATLIVLAGPAANGGQGGVLDLAGMPHTGRIRIYSSSSSCQMAARAW